jgi:hypothetical protein
MKLDEKRCNTEEEVQGFIQKWEESRLRSEYFDYTVTQEEDTPVNAQD